MIANTRVFQATPQPAPVLRQVRRQIFGSSSRLTKGAKPDEQQGQGNHQPERTRHKGVTTNQPAQRQPACQQKQKTGAGQQRTVAHAKLALLGLAEPVVEPGGVPALEAKQKALCQQVGDAQGTQEHQQTAQHARVGAQQHRRQRCQRHPGHRQQPQVGPLEPQEQGWRSLSGQRVAVEQPFQGPKAIFDGVPREQGDPNQSRRSRPKGLGVQALWLSDHEARGWRVKPSASSAGQGANLVVPFFQQAPALSR
ncbi:MAG: hypothetical protein NT071_11385 [Burkholderiales bacterium]|nr:hypothetical protein [Burkholderiales bacterium]